MGLWFESFAIDFYDCGENKQARAKCILSYLSMPVPRSWWEHALKTGHVEETHASFLRKSLAALSCEVGPGEDRPAGCWSRWRLWKSLSTSRARVPRTANHGRRLPDRGQEGAGGTSRFGPVGEDDPLCWELNRRISLKPFLCQRTAVSGLTIIAY